MVVVVFIEKSSSTYWVYLRKIRKKYKSCVVYLEDLLIDLVGEDMIVGLADVVGLKRGESWGAGKDPDG